MDRCFCHFNGFQVKDAVARRRIENAGFITCKELGMDPADKDGNNGLVIANAINAGNKIMLDDDYTITGAPVELSKDISLVGDPRLTFRPVLTISNQDGILFKVRSSVKNIVIENVSFQGNAGKEYVLYNNYATENNGLHCDLISVTNCSFDKVVLYGQPGERLYNGGGGSEVKTFIFSGNDVSNTEGTFCKMHDTKFMQVEIRKNKVRNFKYVLFNFGTENLPSDPTEEDIAAYEDMVANKREALIDNNVVINDFNCVQDAVSTLYHCFVLVECNTVIYTNNHVEGLKASVDIATYDLYASANCVVSEGNLWKNNICFAADHDNCTLMKAKQGEGKKTFRNNRYIIEPEYVNRLVNELGATPEGLWVDLLSITDHAEWNVSENTIDIAVRLRFFPSTIYAKKVDIINNKFTAASFEKCLTARSNGAFWRFEKNILNSTDTETSGLTLYLMTTAQTEGLTMIRNNEFNIPTHNLYTEKVSAHNSTYIVEGNRFVVMKAKLFVLNNATRNEFICTEANAMITQAMQPGRVQMRLDTRSATETPYPIYFTIPEDREVHLVLNLRHYANGKFTSGTAEIHTTADGNITILKDGQTDYNGSLHPETGNSNDIFTGVLKKDIYTDPAKGCRIRGGGAPGLLDVELEVYQ